MVKKRFDIGDEIDFFCKKCKLNLHGNVAAVSDGDVLKVTCRTCRSTQPYVAEKSEEELRARQLRKAFALRDKRRQQFAEQAASRTRAASQGSDVTRRWREATEEVDARFAPRYDKHRAYETGDLVIHGEHGLGVVQQVLHENAFVALFRKVEVPLEMNAERAPEE